ncbi:MAG: ASKHA domain-containing protein [Kiritimatiellaeota bacterium]|nr:ASKHA domain-containing protein [Kiritimatiellota bacterium]
MTIKFQPFGRTVSVPDGITLYEAALAAGIPLRAPCGGKGTCGKCAVNVTRGEPSGWHKACQATVVGDCTVDIPEAALENASQQILTASAEASLHFNPAVRDTATTPYGIAFDLGTTTIVGTLYNLATGADCEVASSLNGQIAFGDDVIARIEAARTSPEAAVAMQKAAVTSLNAIIASLCAEAGIAATDIRDVTLAGNTAMQQLVYGMDVTALGEIPFTPAFFAPQNISAVSLGLDVHPDANLFVFPQIGGFVGGDTVAGILATGIDCVQAPTLFMDIGTNGEIVLALPGGKLLATSAAAGPAFEGARIAQGMRATSGAMDKVWFKDGAFHYTTIGNAPAIGLCGTALIDAVAESLRFRLLDFTGLVATPSETDFPAVLAPDGDDATAIVLAHDNSTDAGATIRLIQRDIRELQLASGALRAAAEMLLTRAGLTAADLDAVLLAGAFGNYIRRENALRVGMFPSVPVEKVKFIGNAASHGARMTLLSTDERARAAAIAAAAEHIELGADPDFQNAFAMAMMFPE